MTAPIAEERLRRQLLTHTGLRRPEDVASWFGAMQAQEYEAAKWAIGLRTRDGTTAADVERALDEGRILRTHVMRPTWHVVAQADIRWLLELTRPCVQRRMAVYNRQLGLDDRTLARSLSVIERALRDGEVLTRTQLGDHLQRAKMPVRGVHLAHVMMHAECDGVVCSGPRRGKQSTYALLAQRAPNAAPMPHDEALATLAQRFWRSHGPATIRDFTWWSGLTAADGKRAVEMIKARRAAIEGRTYWTVGGEPRGTAREVLAHLLPIYDEYLVAYRDRQAVPHPPRVSASGPTFVTFQSVWILGGQVAGTWRAARAPRGVVLALTPLRRISRPERAALAEAIRRYEAFLSLPVKFSMT